MSGTSRGPRRLRTPWLSELTQDDVGLAGAKAARLAAARSIADVPPGFCVGTPAIREHLERSGARGIIERELGRGASHSTEEIAEISDRIQTLVRATNLAAADRSLVFAGLRRLSATAVAVRSSSASEDLPSASFAGQYRSYLGVREPDEVARRVLDCVAGFFAPRAIAYRQRMGADSGDLCTSAVLIQAMVDAVVSGVLMTAHPVTGSRTVLLVESIRGVGSLLVEGRVTPDQYEVDKSGTSPPRERIHAQLEACYLGSDELQRLPEDVQRTGSLDEGDLRRLARMGLALERHFGAPQDVEWAMDRAGRLHLLQVRPMTGLDPDRAS